MNQDLPFFSIIIPTYERPTQLSTCLRALARLDYPLDRFEIIVVDDGGSIPLASVVKQFRGELDLKLCEQKNTGPAGARNLGVMHARGQFLAFTDDDCEPEAGWLRALAFYLTRDPDRMVGGRTINQLSDNPYAETSQKIIEVAYSHFNADPGNARFFASNNIAVAAEHFRELKGFDERFITSEDRDICARWIASGRYLSYAPEAVVYHSHDLNLRTLWRQHFGYGRGALRFHRASNNGARFKPDLVFYLKLLSPSVAHGQTSARILRVGQSSLLMFWSQLANAAGFFYERYQSGKKSLNQNSD